MSCRIDSKGRGESRSNLVFIMSLFAPATMTNDGIMHANGTSAQNNSRARSAQSASRLLCAGESEINSIVTLGLRSSR